MSIYKKLSATKSATWQPPVPNSLLDNTSEKLPVSSRVYPEYLVALYAFFQSEHGREPSSLSQLLLWAVQEATRANWETIERLPNAQFSVDFLRERGFLSTTQENKLALGRISTKEEELQYQLDQAGDNPFALYDFWKDRDPEKADYYLDEATAAFRKAELEALEKEKQPAPPTVEPKDEKVIDHAQKSTDTNEKLDRSAILTPEMLGTPANVVSESE